MTKAISIDEKQQQHVKKVYVNIKDCSLLWNHLTEPWCNMIRSCHCWTHNKVHGQPKGYQEPHNEVRSERPSWPSQLVGFEVATLQVCNLCVILCQPPHMRNKIFFDRMGACVTFDVLYYLMILWIHTCQTFVPQYQKDLDVCFMQQGIKFTEVWHMCFFAGTLIWYHTHRHTLKYIHTDTAQSRASRLTHSYKYIFTSPAMCSQ